MVSPVEALVSDVDVVEVVKSDVIMVLSVVVEAEVNIVRRFPHSASSIEALTRCLRSGTV